METKATLEILPKLKKLTKRSWSISLSDKIEQINYVVRGWVNYFRIANMKKKLIEIDQHLRTRIRVIIWKQWKKIRTRYEALKQLGVKDKIAFNCANTRKGYYNICQSTYVMFAINNERLKRKDPITLLDQYEKVHIEYTN